MIPIAKGEWNLGLQPYVCFDCGHYKWAHGKSGCINCACFQTFADSRVLKDEVGGWKGVRVE